MRRVFSSSAMVAHLWANQSQDTARAGNVSFSGADFYSYSTAVATITHGANGQPVALFTTRHYSSTTSGHVSMAGSAASHLLSFTVPHLTGGAAHAQGRYGWGGRVQALSDPEAHAANLAALAEGFRAEVAKLSRTLGEWPDWRAKYTREAGDKVLAYADTFGLPRPDVDPAAEIKAARRVYLARQRRRNTPEAIRKRERARVRRIEKSRAESDRVLLAHFGDWGSVAESFAGYWQDYGARLVRDLLRDEGRAVSRAEQAAQWAAQRAEREAREAREAAELEAERAANFPRWRSGERYFFPSDGPVLLRVRGGNVETSLGAEVPVSHAQRLYRIVAQHRAAGEEWRANGHSLHVGPFTVSRIAPDGQVTAGCHVIEWPEIEALAVAQGWTGGSGPESLTVNSATDGKGV